MISDLQRTLFMKLFLWNVSTLYIILNALMLLTGCADSNFLDRSKIEGSILMGKSVDPTDPIAQRTVLIAQNFEYKKEQIQYFGLCSGVILNSNTILTAAHCANDFKTSRVVTTLNAHSDRIQNDQIYKIKQVVIHEKYNPTKVKDGDLRYDIAILKLDRRMTNENYDSSYLISISTNQYYENKNWTILKAFIAGFGRNRISDSTMQPTDKMKLRPINGVLEKAEVEINSNQYKEISIILDQNEKAGACSGDSGGPLFVYRDDRLYLQGLAVAVLKSNNKPESNQMNKCNNQSYYLNLDFYKKWISKSLELLKSNI